MPYLGENIKKLGFGLMRLPKNGDAIDIEQTKAMVDAFLVEGYTYFDTAWAYPGSEEAIAQALIRRYPREKFQLATKNAAWLDTPNRDAAVEQFHTSLKRTEAGYFDFYLLHNLGDARTQVFEDYDLWNFAFEQKKKGLIRHVGFSFHSTPEQLEAILTAHPEAEFVQLQINYADWNYAGVQSKGCYEVARRHQKPIVIMEPVKGGLLATPPATVCKVLTEADATVSPSSWALRFAADLEGIITVLSGMSSIEQMQDNLATMRNFTHLTSEQRKVLARAQEEMAKLPLIQCTGCNYCAKVCPQDVGISGSFSALNVMNVYNDKAQADHKYEWGVKQQNRVGPSNCVQCGACEEVCPQHLPIRELLPKAAAVFDSPSK